MIAIFHNIRSIYNVGALFRTADAAGMTKLFLTGYTPSPLDRFKNLRLQFQKTALSAEKSVSWEKIANPAKLLMKLRNDGFVLLAIEQAPRAIPYYQYRCRKKSAKKCALIVGNEIRGLSREILKKCDEILEIPMLGRKESLNVAVAFGIVAFSFLFSRAK